MASDIGANTTIDRGAGPDTSLAGATHRKPGKDGHNVKRVNLQIVVYKSAFRVSTEIGDYVDGWWPAGIAVSLKSGRGCQDRRAIGCCDARH